MNSEFHVVAGCSGNKLTGGSKMKNFHVKPQTKGINRSLNKRIQIQRLLDAFFILICSLSVFDVELKLERHLPHSVG